MIEVLVTTALPTIRAFGSDRLGRLFTPRMLGAVDETARTVPYAADNDCFNGFAPNAWRRMLEHLYLAGGACRFVAVPDVVGDADRTLERFDRFAGYVRELELPVALVLQDGQEDRPVPWSELDAVFVGGSTEWKEGAAAGELVAEAHRRGKWVHMGRVNGLARLRIAEAWSVDSIDGSSFGRFPNEKIPRLLGWLELLQAEREGRAA